MKTLLTFILLIFLGTHSMAQNIASKKRYSSFVPTTKGERFATGTGQFYLIWHEGNKRFINTLNPVNGKMTRFYL